MKKIILAAAAVLFAFEAFAAPAQSDSTSRASKRLDEIEKMEIGKPSKTHSSKEVDLFSLGALSRYQWGWSHLGAPDFADSFGPSKEFLFNVVELHLNPVEWLSLNLGLDLRWENFRVRSDKLYDVDAFGDVTIVPNPGYTSAVSTVAPVDCAFSFPLFLGLHWDLIGIRLGAEMTYNPNNQITSTYIDGPSAYKVTTTVETKPVNNLTYSFFGSVLLGDGLGIYARYSPGEHFPYACTSAADYWTLGIIVDFR